MISSVRPGLMNLTWWQWSLISGVPFGGLMFVFLGSRYPNDWIIWVGAGVGFGAAMGPIIAGQARRLRPLIESVSAEEYVQVRRAAARGPVPADPRLRQAAARFASHRYEEMTRFHVPLLIAFCLFFVLAALAAVVSSPWSWLSAGFFALLLAFQVLWPRRLRRRVERLQAEGGG
jgi:Flp pilus assembly protein TadB